MNDLTTRYRLLVKIKYLIDSRFFLSVLSLIITIAIFSVLTLNAWIYAWLRSKYYYSYQLLYLLIIFFSFLFYLKKYGDTVSVLRTLLFGAVVGYSAGIIAYFGSIFIAGNGLLRLLNSLRFSSIGFILFFPSFWLLSWLFGGVMGIVCAWLSRWAKRFSEGDRGLNHLR